MGRDRRSLLRICEQVQDRKPNICNQIEVYYLVDDMVSAVQALEQRGCRILNGPFEIPIGKGAVIADPFGARLCILDMTKGPRQLNVG
jgi:predicted enzyme related to lactoylglutathione lyase